MSWTDERVETLKKMWAEGQSASQIAKELGGVTRNAVIGKVHRLGLSNRAGAGPVAGGPASAAPVAAPAAAPASPRPAAPDRAPRARAPVEDDDDDFDAVEDDVEDTDDATLPDAEDDDVEQRRRIRPPGQRELQSERVAVNTKH